MSTATSSAFGNSPDDVLQTLATQFRQRSAFVRELVQNALDAGATNIAIALNRGPKYLHILICDDGHGMDRSVIEDHLLVLFRSTKDGDNTQIGGFGVGFVSLFALEPAAVVVDTARYGTHYRVVFDHERHYTLVEVDEPFEGTSIELLLELTDDDAAELALEVRNAVHHWCRYAPADITIDGEGPGFSFADEKVDHEFSVEAAVTVEDIGPGFRAVLGLTDEPKPLTAYYNGGLTLVQTTEPTIPGVTFRVESGTLGHTLTRDNVRRDENFERVIDRLQNLARGRLVQQYVSALKKAAVALDHQALDQLLAHTTHPLVSLPRELACFRTSAGSLVSLATAVPRSRFQLRRLRPVVLQAPLGDPLGTRLTRAGIPVLAAKPHVDAHQVSVLLGADLVDPHSRYIAPLVVEHPVVQAIISAQKLCGLAQPGCAVAHFGGYGQAIADKLAICQHEPGAIELVAQTDFLRGTPVVNLDHPTVQELVSSPMWVAGPMLFALIQRELGEAFAPSPRLLGVMAGHACAAEESRD